MTSKTASATGRAALQVAIVALGLGAFQACGSSGGFTGSSPDGGSLAGADSTSGGALNLVGSGGALSSLGGNGAAVGGASGSANAVGGACTGANCGVAGPGKAAGATCAAAAQCQSGRCEPTTGMTGEACLSACFSDGVACTRALDCCSTGCLNGTCGGQCKIVADPCKVNAECCSNVCQAGQCQIDMPNRDCRPTGEDCTKGGGSGCCNTCNKDTGRCDFGPDTCFAQGVACTATTQCCHGECLNNRCTTPCVAQAGACAANADCCSVSCVAGRCQPPPPVTGAGGSPGVGTDGGITTCVLTGNNCTVDGECCSSFCFGGFCEAPVH